MGARLHRGSGDAAPPTLCSVMSACRWRRSPPRRNGWRGAWAKGRSPADSLRRSGHSRRLRGRKLLAPHMRTGMRKRCRQRTRSSSGWCRTGSHDDARYDCHAECDREDLGPETRNADIHLASGRKSQASTTAMKDAAPAVNAGNRMWQAMTQVSWMRDSRLDRRASLNLWCFGSPEDRCISKPDEFFESSGIYIEINLPVLP